MRAVLDLDRYLEAPVDRYWVGRTFLFWCKDRTLRGWAVWGRPSEHDVEQLVRCMDDHRSMRLPFDVVHDVRRLESIDTAAFHRFHAYVESHLPRDALEIRRHAIVRGAGLAGMVAAGFNFVLASPTRWLVCTDPQEAFRWFGRSDADSLCREVETLIESAVTPWPSLGRLRAYLSSHLEDASLAGAAGALATSPRTLQRLLRSADTSFRGELVRARVSEAWRLLTDTDWKIEVIARKVGFGSPEHFGAVFRRLQGSTPSRARSLARSR